jgi:hypothetical protein
MYKYLYKYNKSKVLLRHFHGTTTLSITTLSIKALSIMGLLTTLSINDTQPNSIECHYAECHDYFNVMLSVVVSLPLF